jgi:hypothetical protein
MGVLGGPDRFGLWPDADLRSGTNSSWTLGTYQSSGGPDGEGYVQITGGGGSGYQSNRIPVDTSKSYQQVIYAKTITPGTSGNNAGGHIGFACYDENDSFIDLRHLKGLGDTTLTRAASPGDTTIYVANASGWSLSTSSHQRGYMLFGGIYPFSAGYSRYAVTNNAYSTTSITNIGGGEYSISLTSGLPTWTDALTNGSYPIGTYLSNGRAGGSYNYALGAPTYGTDWTRYATPVFTGESRNSGYPFRYGTKYIRFLILRNYNRRTESPQDHVWGLSKFFFGQVVDGRDYPSTRI